MNLRPPRQFLHSLQGQSTGFHLRIVVLNKSKFTNVSLPLIWDFRIPGQSLRKENCHNSRTSDDIDMALGPVRKLHKSKKTASKNLTVTSCRKIATSLSVFQITANLEQSGSQISDTQSVKRMVSLKVIFYLTKTENITKKSLTQLSHYCFE